MQFSSVKDKEQRFWVSSVFVKNPYLKPNSSAWWAGIKLFVSSSLSRDVACFTKHIFFPSSSLKRERNILFVWRFLSAKICVFEEKILFVFSLIERFLLCFSSYIFVWLHCFPCFQNLGTIAICLFLLRLLLRSFYSAVTWMRVYLNEAYLSLFVGFLCLIVC